MAFEYLHVFTGRRIPLDYISPAVCDGEWSSTGSPTISLQPLRRKNGPTGLVMTPSFGVFRLDWGVVPGALCYSVYKAVNEEDPYGDYALVAECISDNYLEGLDDGWYYVVVVTPTGLSDPSDPIHITGSSTSCLPETGDPCPEGASAFAIGAPVEHPEFVVTGINSNPVVSDYYQVPLEGDYPPGHYELRYLDGYVLYGESIPAGYGGLLIYGVGDDEHAWVDPALVIEGALKDRLGLISMGGYLASGSCTTPEEVLAEMAGWFYAPAPNGERRWYPNQSHTNSGGTLKAYFPTSYMGTLALSAESNLTLQLIQTDGLKQQPRGLQIENYASMSAQFPVGMYEAWNGVLPDRTTYEAIQCVHTAASSGAFGGATVSYTQEHPTAANGCGWVLEIFNGLDSYWKGYKIIGDTGVGLYMRAAGYAAGPDCIRIEEYSV